MKKITNLLLLLVLSGSLSARKTSDFKSMRVNHGRNSTMDTIAGLAVKTDTPIEGITRNLTKTPKTQDHFNQADLNIIRKELEEKEAIQLKNAAGQVKEVEIKEVEAEIEEVEAKTPGFFRRNKGKLIAGSSIAATAALGTALALFFPEHANTAINYAFSLFSKAPEVASQAFNFTTQSSATEYLIKPVVSKAPGIVTEATNVNFEDISNSMLGSFVRYSVKGVNLIKGALSN